MMLAEVGHLVVLSLGLGAFVIALGCAPTQVPADLVLRDGKIVTLDEGMPEAEALAVKACTGSSCGLRTNCQRVQGW